MKYTYTLEELPLIASKILEATPNKTLLFYGEMGVGKTTLIKELAKGLGVDEGLSSPTFSIVNEYTFDDDRLYHFDFYRIEDEVQALDIGVEEYFDSGHWNFVEWPEKIASLLPASCTKIELSKNTNGSRNLDMVPVN